MRWLYVLQRAVADLAAQAGRSLLIVAALSIAIGSFCFGVSLQSSMRQAITVTNMGRVPSGFTIYSDPVKGKELTIKDLHAVEQALAGRARVNAVQYALASPLNAGPKNCGLVATFYPEQSAANVLLSGRWISEQDDHEARLVGVANPALLKQLSLNPRSALGKTIQLSGLPFTLIGTEDNAAPLKAAYGDMRTFMLRIPYSTLRSRFLRSDELLQISVPVPQGKQVEGLAGEAVGVLRKSRGLTAATPNDFTVISSKDVRNRLLALTRPFRIASGLTALVSALLAVSVGWYLFTLLVDQGKREMGIQRALGASRAQVFLGHVVEAWTLLGLSILLGVLMSWAVTWIVRTHFASHDTDYAVDWKLFVGTSFQDVLITFITWAVLGTCIALLPVRKVLKMPLPELLR